MTDNKVMMICDLHLHSRFSDGRLTVEQLVDLYGQAGFDAIAVTDHLCVPKNFLGFGARVLNRTLTFQNWKEYLAVLEKEKNRAWRQYKMLLIPGVEYTNNTFNYSRNAHMLSLDVKDFVSPYLDEVSWLKEMRSQNALTVAAHPLKLKDASSQTYYLIENQKLFASLIDVWEVANHKTVWTEMLETPYSLIATSDFHTQANWGAWRTRLECEKDVEAIKNFFRDPRLKREFVYIDTHARDVKKTIVLDRSSTLNSGSGIYRDARTG